MWGELAKDSEAQFTKHSGGKSGGCASKAAELTSGDPSQVTESGLRMEQSMLIVGRESAAGIVGRQVEGPNSKERRVGRRTRRTRARTGAAPASLRALSG